MMDLVLLGCVLMVMSGLFKYVFNVSHLLVSLLSLEGISLGVYWGYVGGLYLNYFEVISSFYFLMVMVCSGVVGLSLLVCMSYSYGSDLLKSDSMMSC